MSEERKEEVEVKGAEEGEKVLMGKVKRRIGKEVLPVGEGKSVEDLFLIYLFSYFCYAEGEKLGRKDVCRIMNNDMCENFKKGEHRNSYGIFYLGGEQASDGFFYFWSLLREGCLRGGELVVVREPSINDRMRFISETKGYLDVLSIGIFVIFKNTFSSVRNIPLVSSQRGLFR